MNADERGAGRCRSCRHATPYGGGHTVDCGQGQGYNIDRDWGCEQWERPAPETPAPSGAGPVRLTICWYPDVRGFNCVRPAGHSGDHEPAAAPAKEDDRG
jgi:hypothetical protein